jgi:hypothetical protein
MDLRDWTQVLDFAFSFVMFQVARLDLASQVVNIALAYYSFILSISSSLSSVAA